MIVSRLKVFPSKPPTTGLAFASSGKSVNSLTAETWSPAPIVKRISAALGDRATIDLGYPPALALGLRA